MNNKTKNKNASTFDLREAAGKMFGTETTFAIEGVRSGEGPRAKSGTKFWHNSTSDYVCVWADGTATDACGDDVTAEMAAYLA